MSAPESVPQWKQRVMHSSQSAIDIINKQAADPGVPIAPRAFFSFGKPDPKPAPTPSSSDSIPEKQQQQLKEFCRIALGDQKKAVVDFSKQLREAIVSSAGKESIRKTAKAAYEDIKTKITNIIDKQTDSAIDYIGKIPEDQQEAAADYWGDLSERVYATFALAMECITSTITRVIELNIQICSVDARMNSELERTFESAAWMLK